MTTQTHHTSQLEAVVKQIGEQAAAGCAASGIPGFVAGIHHGGGQAAVAHGIANLATGAPMRVDTGFLIGSVTKVLTTTLVLHQVDKGVIDLDEPVVRYLPEFRLATPGAEEIRVRHLLNHTNGIDADLFFPAGDGPGAQQVFLDGLRSCGSLFRPGQYVSYSNGGMNLAGCLLEAVTGTPYLDLLEREVYAPVGMQDSSTTAEQAILRGTAVGHFHDLATMQVHPTAMFKLPDTWAPAGASAISTVGDLLAFARTHLAGGVAPSGTRLLSAESTALMRSASVDMVSPSVPPLGLGWLLMPFGDTTVVTMTGASPGGVAVLALVPEHDFAFAAYSNHPQSVMLHDEILLGVLREHLGIAVPDLISGPVPDVDLTPYAGTYRSNQLRVDVSVVDGQLEESMTYEPADAVQESIFTRFAGGVVQGSPRRFVPVGRDLFAPAGLPAAAFNGYLRQLLVTYHGVEAGRATHRSAGGRMTRRDH